MFIYLVQTQGKSFSTRPSLPRKKLVVRSFYCAASYFFVVFPVKGSPERKGDNPKSNMAENKLTVVWVCYPSSLLPSRNSLFFCFVNMQPREKGITAVWLLCEYLQDKFLLVTFLIWALDELSWKAVLRTHTLHTYTRGNLSITLCGESKYNSTKQKRQHWSSNVSSSEIEQMFPKKKKHIKGSIISYNNPVSISCFLIHSLFPFSHKKNPSLISIINIHNTLLLR